MKAVQIDRYGGSDVLRVVDLAVPLVRAGEVLVKVAYAGVNFTDIYRRQGHYARSGTYLTELPLVPGIEGGGRIEAVGEGVSGLVPGDRVVFFVPNGAYAEYAVANAAKVAKVPDEVELDIAVALMIQGLTAHYLTHSAFDLKPGDRCLVHAAAGGVGQLLVQIAKLKGAQVLATAGSEAKATIARRLGADLVIPYRQTDFREAVMQATDGRGVDVVYDSVGKDTLRGSLRSLRPRGLCVLFGHSSGMVDAIAPMELAEAGSVFLTRPHMQHYVATREEFDGRMKDLFTWLAAHKLKVLLDRTLPLQRAAQAHDLLEGRATAGKLLLSCG
jgi:NADPH:quinone reductase